MPSKKERTEARTKKDNKCSIRHNSTTRMARMRGPERKRWRSGGGGAAKSDRKRFWLAVFQWLMLLVACLAAASAVQRTPAEVPINDGALRTGQEVAGRAQHCDELCTPPPRASLSCCRLSGSLSPQQAAACCCLQDSERASRAELSRQRSSPKPMNKLGN